MANTWQGIAPDTLPPNFDLRKSEGASPALQYQIRRLGNGLEFSVVSGAGVKTALPVEAVVGGKRHGESFLLRVDRVAGIPIARPALLEARYAYSPHDTLVLSPGFQKEKPEDLEGTLGRTLSPDFEQRCLTCHGKPGTLGAGSHGGVRCESCHGPASAHVSSMAPGTRGQTPAMPAQLKGTDVMPVCGQCHTGLSSATHSDPLPGDLLVSSQVSALRQSECFIQSGEGISCTNCHDPHRDSATVAQTSEKTCLGCHAMRAPRHASICPINAKSDCVRCHMPSVESNGFRLTDHWIAVHPEAGIKAAGQDDNLKSLVAPKREYLQIIVTGDRAKAEAAQARIANGESFYDVAHDSSIDPTAPGGGFAGDMRLADMDASLASAAAGLPYGGTSGILEQGGRSVILHRLPRDFKWTANQLFQQAVTLKAQGDVKAALAKDQEALKAYPYFLRGLVFMGTTLAEAGQTQRASRV